MKNWDVLDENNESRTCSIDKDFDDMKQLCERLDIPYYQVHIFYVILSVYYSNC